MKLLYIANIRLPTEKAHGVQIMKMCEAFALVGLSVELVVSNRATPITEDPFTFYHVRKTFTITRLPCIDLVAWGRVGFFLQSLSFSIAVLWYAWNKKIDIIYGRDEMPLLSFSFLYPHVVWESHRGGHNFFVRLLLGRTKLVCISRGLRDFYVGFGVPKGNICVAHDGIDESFLGIYSKSDARRQLGLPPDQKIAMYFGSLDAWKGVRTLFSAARQLAKQGVHVAIAGGSEQELTSLRQEFPEVRFLGYTEYKDLPALQVAADVLVVPNSGRSLLSTKYTSPLKVFAHMASGVPIVASDLPSIRETLHEHNAVLVTPDEPIALAEAIATLLANATRMRDLAAQARSEVEQHTWHKRAVRIIDFMRPA